MVFEFIILGREFFLFIYLWIELPWFPAGTSHRGIWSLLNYINLWCLMLFCFVYLCVFFFCVVVVVVDFCSYLNHNELKQLPENLFCCSWLFYLYVTKMLYMAAFSSPLRSVSLIWCICLKIRIQSISLAKPQTLWIY